MENYVIAMFVAVTPYALAVLVVKLIANMIYSAFVRGRFE